MAQKAVFIRVIHDISEILPEKFDLAPVVGKDPHAQKPVQEIGALFVRPPRLLRGRFRGLVVVDDGGGNDPAHSPVPHRRIERESLLDEMGGKPLVLTFQKLFQKAPGADGTRLCTVKFSVIHGGASQVRSFLPSGRIMPS